jgi:four helix bundle suffix protein
MANTALTLCYMTDSMLHHALQYIEQDFVERGGIKERMYAARTGYRRAEDEELARLRQEVPALRSEITRLRQLLAQHGIDYGQERE